MDMRLPCEGSATFDAFSTVWIGIMKPATGYMKWGQVGITRRRNAGSANVTQYRKYEIKAGPNAADYHLEQQPGFPAVGTNQAYECVVDPATGRWNFNAGPGAFTWQHAGWIGESGIRVDFNAEVYDLGSQMPGTSANKCKIANCQYKQGTPTSSSSSSGLISGAYVNAALVAANVSVTAAAEHGADFVSGTEVHIWDRNP
jgi:hypothetical protein